MTKPKRARRDKKADKSGNSDISGNDTSMDIENEDIQTFSQMKKALITDLTSTLTFNLSKVFKAEHEEFKTFVQTSIDEIKKSQDFISTEFEDIKSTLENHSTKIVSHEQKIEHYEVLLTDADFRIHYLEQMQLNPNFVISNVIQQNNEKTEELAVNIVKFLCPDMELIENRIMNIVRIKPRKPMDISPILVRTLDPRIKISIMKAINKTKIFCDQFNLGVHKQIFVNNHLTGRNQKLLGRARFLKKAGKIESAYYANGYIYIRKTPNSEPIKILSNHDLEIFDST